MIGDLPPEMNIHATAARVTALLEQQRTREAIAMLEREREHQSLAVQEALDRYVAAEAQVHLDALRRPGALPQMDQAALAPTLQRLQEAQAAPRFPTAAEMTALASDAQRYDIYASIIATRGNQAAVEALSHRNERVMLGLRQENSTLEAAEPGRPSVARTDNPRTLNTDESRLGTGVYDDRIIVLWKDAQDRPQVHQVNRANTEPTAQYDHHAGANGTTRIFSDDHSIAPRLSASQNYGSVRAPRKIEGEDVNDDRIRDLGRIAEGTVSMEATRHRNPAFINDPRSFSPTGVHPNQAQRDTNGDGWFNSNDINGVQDLNTTFKIHSGSRNNTDSAGCQTIYPDDYHAFMEAARGNPQQTRWQYVLTNTTPGMFRGVQATVDQTQEQVQPARPAQPLHPARDPAQDRDHERNGHPHPPEREDEQRQPQAHLQAPGRNASVSDLFSHLVAAMQTGDENAFRQAISTIAASNIGQEFRAQTVARVDAQEQRHAADLAEQQRQQQSQEQDQTTVKTKHSMRLG